MRGGAGSQERGQGPAGREGQSAPGGGGRGVGACLPTVGLQQQPGAEITTGGVAEEGPGRRSGGLCQACHLRRRANPQIVPNGQMKKWANHLPSPGQDTGPVSGRAGVQTPVPLGQTEQQAGYEQGRVEMQGQCCDPRGGWICLDRGQAFLGIRNGGWVTGK